MSNFRFLVLGMLSFGLVAAGFPVAAQENLEDAETGYSHIALSDLERHGVFANCESKMAYVDNALFVEPSDDGANGIIYNACMSANVKPCGTYKDGKLVSISNECVDSARKICNFAANMKF